ncbi:MAG: glycosyltransferase, partial [Pseudomonadota bacterium]
KLRGFFRGVRHIKDQLHVLTPLVIPFSWFPMREQANKLFIKAQISWAQKKLGMMDSTLMVFSQNWLPYVKTVSQQCLVYYCVDEHSGFKGVDTSNFQAWDEEMTRQADLVCCSSQTLVSAKKRLNPNTVYTPHGVNDTLFRTALSSSTPIADDLLELPTPRLLFFGHISYDWVDVDLLKYCAKQTPDWSWVLVGRYSLKNDEFADFANIHWLGEKEFEILPQYCKGATLGLIPFVDSKLTENCHPLKLPEYFAAGLPVVSTNIPAVREDYSQWTEIAVSREEFLVACRKIVELSTHPLAQSLSQQRSEAMKSKSWAARVDDLLILVNKSQRSTYTKRI